MAKVIIKVNSFMQIKEFTDICNFIYDQYKKRDIIMVPCYCDVYIVDGNPELKVEKDTENNFTYADGKTAEEVKEIINNIKNVDCMHCEYSDGGWKCSRPTGCYKEKKDESN